jgi:NADPH:quinone reductase-like Zn-dependent oxidoreductase
MLGIQFAKLSGYRVLATCSPRNADYLQSLGADDIIDYREYSDPERFAARVREILGGDRLGLVWDCIGLPESAKLVVPAIARTGGKYRSLLPVPDEIVHGINDRVDGGWTFAYLVFGEKFTKGRGTFEARPEDMEFGRTFWDLSRDLLQSGKLKVPRQEVNRGGKGLEGVLKGLDELRQDKVSGVKLIYTL